MNSDLVTGWVKKGYNLHSEVTQIAPNCRNSDNFPVKSKSLMKHAHVLLIAFALSAGYADAQENLMVIQGGSATSSGNALNSSLTGFKINGAWEFQPMGDKWTMGGSIGYVQMSATVTNGTVKVTSIPIAFVARYMVGGEKFKVFARGSLGTQISTGSYSGTVVNTSDSQWGMSGSIGAGVMYWASDKLFISAEYEFLWLSNAIQNAGSVGCAMGGIGLRF